MQWFEEIFFEKFFRGIGAWRFLGATGRVWGGCWSHVGGVRVYADASIENFTQMLADRADFFDFVDGYHLRLEMHCG